MRQGEIMASALNTIHNKKHNTITIGFTRARRDYAQNFQHMHGLVHFLYNENILNIPKTRY